MEASRGITAGVFVPPTSRKLDEYYGVEFENRSREKQSKIHKRVRVSFNSYFPLFRLFYQTILWSPLVPMIKVYILES